MFDRIAPVYDGMNAAISGFQEPRWRRRAVRSAALRPGMRALDIACGTGKVLIFEVGDALSLGVEDGAFDAATIAFGMRNLADYRQGFAEMWRAVRPGGRVVCLEIARPTSRLGRVVQAWFDSVVPLIGRLVGQGAAYAYLVRSTKSYPSPKRISEIMTEVGLEQVRWSALSGGIVTIHVGLRPSATLPE